MRRYFAPVILALTVIGAVPAFANDRNTAPSASEIESILRRALAERRQAARPADGFRDAELLDFALDSIARTAPGRWRAEATLELDFGPPPPGIVGFERHRRGAYDLWLTRRGDSWRIERFNPKGSVQLLPSGGT